MRKLFVTGLGGYLGSELARRAPGAGWEVAGTVMERPAPPGVRSHRIDIREEQALREVLRAERPDAVVHTAYRRSGPDAESVIVDGARAVAAAARGARLIHLSTDLVFSGTLGRPLTEEDPPDPSLDYGVWKARAEEAMSEALIVRTSLIYGGAERSDHERLALDPGDATFFTDELRNPIAVGDLAAAILELAEVDLTGPLHVAGADAVNRLEFAELIARRRQRGGPGGPERPKDCRLDCSRAQKLLSVRLRGAREVLEP